MCDTGEEKAVHLFALDACELWREHFVCLPTMTYRAPQRGVPSSSSSSPVWAGMPSSSPPSSPTNACFGRTSGAVFDPFSASAKSLSISAPRKTRFTRSCTTPARGGPARRALGLDVAPREREAAPDVLERFFDEGSEVSVSSIDEVSSEVDSSPAHAGPMGQRVKGGMRSFARTESASTDPLSAAGRTDSMQRAPQRARPCGTSPKKLTRRDADAGSLAAWEQADEGPRPRPGQVHWDAVVSRVFDEGREKPALLFGGYGLTHISSVIGDLQHYVTIEPRRADCEGARESPRHHLQLFLWDNRLTRLPSALFQLTNLGVLSLRKNQLTHLPAAIGTLCNLRELNIGGNALAYLPAEIQQLQLDTFTYVPNPFVSVPPGAVLDVRTAYGQEAQVRAGPRWSRAHTLATSVPGHAVQRGLIARVLGAYERLAAPSLLALCMQRLLSGDPALIAEYETGCLQALEHTLDARVVARLEAARRSATASWGGHIAHSAKDPLWYEGAAFYEADEQPRVCTATDVDTMLEEKDDASANFWYNRCPAPKHGTISGGDWPTAPSGPLFVHAAEQRIEWVSHVAGVRVAKQGIELAGASVRGMPAEHAGCLPILWRGCSHGCLAFLEHNHEP